MKKRITAALIQFLKTRKNSNLLFCNNGIFKLQFETRTSPTYYSYGVKQYNPSTKKFENVHWYGSPFIEDVSHALQYEISH